LLTLILLGKEGAMRIPMDYYVNTFPKVLIYLYTGQEYLNEVAWLLNTRPRKRYKYQTPQKLFNEEIKRVALAS
jgi:hypothetical protein